MYHIIYSKTGHDYQLFLEDNGVLYYDTHESEWSDTIQDLLNRPFAFQTMSTASSTWFQDSIYSSPTKPTLTLLSTSHPELII